MRHPYCTTFLAVTAVVLLTGCSVSQMFHLSLTVVNKEDRKPITDAKVTLDTMSVEEQKNNVEYPFPHRGGTDQNGIFESDFSISGYPSTQPHWYLKVWKDGNEPVIVDIKPTTLPPERSRNTLPVNVRVEMQPVAKPLR